VIGTLLIGVLSQAPVTDGGTSCQLGTNCFAVDPASPAFIVEQAGEKFVCETEVKAMQLAQTLVDLKTERDDLKKSVLSTDPAWLKVVLVGLGALLAGAALSFGWVYASGHFH
jgi:energy-converting hydrogenase Eha subunit G